MGKQRGNKHNIRNNPVGLPSLKDIMLEEDEILDGSGDMEYVPNLIEQLKSHVAEERDSGLNSLSVSCQNPKLLQELLDQDVIKTASSLLVDSSAMVRHSAAGALRNMSMLGDTICELMVNQDVMTPLVALLKQKYASAWEPHKKKDGKIDTITETFVQAVNLLWNLCESNDTALNTFNREGLLEFLARRVNVAVYGVSVVLPIVQLFHAVTDNNPNLEVAKADELVNLLEAVAIGDGEDMQLKYLQVLCIGVILNLRQGQISKLSSIHTSSYVKSLIYPLDVNHITDIEKITQNDDFLTDGPEEKECKGVKIQIDSAANGGDEVSMETNGVRTIHDEVDSVLHLLNAQYQSLTIFSNILCDEDDDGEGSESGESVTDFDGATEDATMDTEDEWSSGLSPEVHEIVVKENLKAKLLDKIQPLPPSVFEILSKKEAGLKIFRLVSQVRATALLCFQNLVGRLELSELGGVEETERIFAESVRVLFEEANAATPQFGNMNLIEAITSLQRSVMQKWTEDKAAKPSSWFNLDNLNVRNILVIRNIAIFQKVYSGVTEAKIQTNIVKIIGGYGVLLSRIPTTTQDIEMVKLLLSQVAEFLLTCICDPFEKDHLPVAAEALDTVFDVFAEDDHNDVLNKLEAITKLRQFFPVYKKFIQAQRRTLGEHAVIIQTSKSNLTRFISYKLRRGCC